MRGKGVRGTRTALFVLALLGASTPARAFEVSAGISVGGILAGTVPHLALSPHVGLSWRTESGVLLGIHDLLGVIFPAGKGGVGVYNQTSGAVGYAWANASFSVGPSLSIYSMPACRDRLCSRVIGIAPGGHAQAALYFVGPLGVSVWANLDWIGGQSRVLPGGVAAMAVAGPVLRW
jgi:hypothetical protein